MQEAMRYLRRITRLLRGLGLEVVHLFRALFQGPFQSLCDHALRLAERGAVRNGVPLALG